MVIKMTFADVFLLSIFYFWASSTSLSLGIGYYTIYRPIIAGMLTGIILKDAHAGMLAGAVVNIVYADFVSTGGSLRGDQCLTAVMAAAAAIVFKLNSLEAAAISFPFGFLGILIWKYRLKINNIFVNIYERKYREGAYPDICLYNVVFPQLLLYVLSTLVLMTALYSMYLFHKLIDFNKINTLLHYLGIILIIFSAFNILYKMKNKYNFIIFLSVFTIALILNVRAYLLFIAAVIFLLFISGKKPAMDRNKPNGIIKKRDLIYSWFIWMNHSHACYSYERLMGLAFAHSMKNIFKKLYNNKDDIAEAIHNHTEFFNTEPNMGTPIHGYIISLEEERRLNNQSFESSDISYIKKGMMGISAGLGDSFTQVVLTPLFISMSVMLCLDKSFYLAVAPMFILSAYILFISYTGFMRGYFQGRDSMLQRIKEVKQSKIKKYFPYMFSGILGLSMSRLLFKGLGQRENIITLIIILSAAAFTLIRNRGEK